MAADRFKSPIYFHLEEHDFCNHQLAFWIYAGSLLESPFNIRSLSRGILSRLLMTIVVIAKPSISLNQLQFALLESFTCSRVLYNQLVVDIFGKSRCAQLLFKI